MDEKQHLAVVYRSDVLGIGDFHCCPSSVDCGREKWSSCFKVVFPRSGAFVRHVAGKRVFADATRILFFNRREAYRTSHPVAQGDTCSAFVVPPAVLAEMRSVFEPDASERPDAPLPFSDCPSSARLFLMQKRLLDYAGGGDADPVGVDEIGLELVGEAIAGAQAWVGRPARRCRAGTECTHQEAVARVEALLAQRFRSVLSLSEIAAAVHCSPFHLCRVFRRETGFSIHHYRIRLRLRESLNFVAEPDSDLTGIALDLGFSSHSHFTDSFRREFGMAPSEFRRGATLSRLGQMRRILEASDRPNPLSWGN